MLGCYLCLRFASEEQFVSSTTQRSLKRRMYLLSDNPGKALGHSLSMTDAGHYLYLHTTLPQFEL